jgi:hypothetical protein
LAAFRAGQPDSTLTARGGMGQPDQARPYRIKIAYISRVFLICAWPGMARSGRDHTFGNGEVDSSILSGSTIQRADYLTFFVFDFHRLPAQNWNGTTA